MVLLAHESLSWLPTIGYATARVVPIHTLTVLEKNASEAKEWRKKNNYKIQTKLDNQRWALFGGVDFGKIEAIVALSNPPLYALVFDKIPRIALAALRTV